MIKNLLPKRIADSNKGTYGKLVDIAGHRECAGCAVLSALSAMRSGLGMVKVVSASSNFTSLMCTVPEALFSSDLAEADIEWSDCILIGPGIGMGKKAVKRLKAVLASEHIPLVIDADGINIISADDHMREMLYEKAGRDTVIITPHIMEMSRFSGHPVNEIRQNMTGIASKYAADYNVTVVLKDARTVTASPDGRMILNTTGNNGMSTAGSGDVLAGIIASLLAQGCDGFTAASVGAYIHGAAGDAAARRYGVRGMKASDIAESLPEVLLQL